MADLRHDKSGRMPELKPCPFCGGKSRFIYDIELEITGIRCPKCHAGVRFTDAPKPKKTDTYGETMEWWLKRWNQRTERKDERTIFIDETIDETCGYGKDGESE